MEGRRGVSEAIEVENGVKQLARGKRLAQRKIDA